MCNDSGFTKFMSRYLPPDSTIHQLKLWRPTCLTIHSRKVNDSISYSFLNIFSSYLHCASRILTMMGIRRQTPQPLDCYMIINASWADLWTYLSPSTHWMLYVCRMYILQYNVMYSVRANHKKASISQKICYSFKVSTPRNICSFTQAALHYLQLLLIDIITI